MGDTGMKQFRKKWLKRVDDEPTQKMVLTAEPFCVVAVWYWEAAL